MHTERANAKINLYLNVVGRRENGYHELVSVMQTVSLSDLVTLSFTPSEHTDIRLDASGNSNMPTDSRNLAWRAADRYLNHIQVSGTVTIFIEKKIPMAAGLAGGSADAAAVLRGLNCLCGKPLSAEELCELGASLGADIPFCIMGGAALVTGIGERLEKIPCMPASNLVVACMGEGVSTPWAYRALDERFAPFPTSKQDDLHSVEMLRAIQNEDLPLISQNCFNLFEAVVPPVHSCVNLLKQTMIRGGALCSMMSGSGPSVFGIFPDLEHAEQACRALQDLGAAAFVCSPV